MVSLIMWYEYIVLIHSSKSTFMGNSYLVIMDQLKLTNVFEKFCLKFVV